MKRLLYLFPMIFLVIILIVGCSEKIVDQKLKEDKVIPNKLTSEMGKGKIIITTPTNNSEDKETPVIYIDDYKGLVQLGLESKDFDSSKSSYIYIDEKLNTIEELGKSNSINLTIYEEDLNEGIHKIEVVQYHNNKTSGTPITYKNCNYKIEKR